MKKICVCLLCLLLFSINVVFSAENLRWAHQPISVYIPITGDYSTLMVKAFKHWEKKSNKLVRFVAQPNPKKADIKVEFVKKLSDEKKEKSGAVGITHLAYDNAQYLKSATIEILMSKDGELAKVENIYHVMIHEIGHALGLGHNENNPKSIMYPVGTSSLYTLTKEDLYMLYKKYR